MCTYQCITLWQYNGHTHITERYYYFMPPTSFYNSNLKSCKFQRVDGFQNFDFTKIAKNSQGHPELNGVDFTLTDLTEANFTNCRRAKIKIKPRN